MSLCVPLWRRSLFSWRVLAGAEHVQALRQMQGCRTVIDVGANRGQFSLAVRYCWRDAKIFAFEPLQAPAKRFLKLFASDQSVRLYTNAVGPVERTATMHRAARDDSSSLLPITTRQSRVFPGTAEVGLERVQVGRLARYVKGSEIDTPALLKLDVQGFELEALRGCADLLGRFSWVYCELSFIELYEGQALADEVVCWLQQRDLMLVGIYNVTYDVDGHCIQADFLFERKLAQTSLRASGDVPGGPCSVRPDLPAG